MNLAEFNDTLEPHGLTMLGYNIRTLVTDEYVGVVSLDKKAHIKRIVLSIRASIDNSQIVKTLALLNTINCVGPWGTEYDH